MVLSSDCSSRRIGLLVPCRNATLEPEVYQVVPPGVSWHFSRLDGTGDTEAGLKDMRRDLAQAAASLSTLNLSALIFACTAATFFEGRRRGEELDRELASSTGVPTLTAGRAVVLALEAFGAKRIAVLTPYRSWLTERLVRYLREYGIDALRSASMGLTQDIDRIHGGRLADQARSVSVGETVDALFISCTNLPTLHQLAALEAETNIPVISSNQALVWAALQRAGLETRGMDHLGSLFDRLVGEWKGVVAAEDEGRSVL